MKKRRDPNSASDDRTCSLLTLRAQAGKPLRDVILEISKDHLISNDKSTDFIENLKGVLPLDMRNPSDQGAQARPVMLELCSQVKNFVALSYTWDSSCGESVQNGGYRLLRECVPVRDIVLDRTIRFIRYKRPNDMIPLWIDQLSIDQENDYEHEMGMRSMDLVYKICDFAVGYLWVEMRTQVQVDRLSDLLSGQIVKDKSSEESLVLEEGVDATTANEVLKVLVRITDDQWWSRAWVFQEDYIAGKHMWLLIRHTPGLNKPCQLGTLSGELVVLSAKFRKYATLFCLALCQRRDQSLSARTACQKILQKAGQYRILHKYPINENPTQATLTMYILMDLNTRNISVPSDILPITANVCGYDTRILIRKKKEKPKISLSLAVLTLCISNGEMLRNDKMEVDPYGNIFDFLRDYVMEIEPPFPDGALTFTKHCRLSVTHLTKNGIYTEGILWKLSDPIRPTRFKHMTNSSRSGQWETQQKGLGEYQRNRLRDLVAVLNQRKGPRYEQFINDLTNYVQHHRQPTRRKNDWSAADHMNIMAAYIVDAMDAGKYLQLARPVRDLPERRTCAPYRAVFVRNNHDMQRSGPAYIFTSWTHTSEQREDAEQCRSLAKFVSLEVHVGGTTDGVANLRTRRWNNGLCFFRGEKKSSFVFPWPELLCE